MKLTKVYLNHFRKFENIQVKIGSKLTVIGGINGIGKSSILGIISAANGVKKKGINLKHFHPEFRNYFNISEQEEYSQFNVTLEYDKKSEKGDYYFTLALRAKNDKNNNRGIRLIPKAGIPYGKKFTKKSMEEEFGIKEKRVQNPCIYLGMSRLYPIGESEFESSKIKKAMNKKKYYEYFSKIYEFLLPHSIDRENSAYLENIKNSSKNMSCKLTNTFPNTVSVGQDNLSIIISSIIEIIYFRDKYPEIYNSSIICIDEIEAALHPGLALRLLEILEQVSEKCNIQFVLTTHSIEVLKYMLEKEKKDDNKYAVNYFVDSNVPRLSKNKYEDISDSLHDTISLQKTDDIEIIVYAEDETTIKIFNGLLEIVKKTPDFNKYRNYKFECKSLNLGCNQLRNLLKSDDIFRTRVILLDGDARTDTNINRNEYMRLNHQEYGEKVKGISNKVDNYNNILILPTILPPELYAFNIMYQYGSDANKYRDFWNDIGYNPQYSSLTTDVLKLQFNINKNITWEDLHNSNGGKFDKCIELLIDSGMLEHYYSLDENKEELNDFKKNLIRSIDSVITSKNRNK